MYTHRIEKAIQASAVLHREQVRKGPARLPYITHLYAVSLLVSDYTEDEDTIIAALLHDTIEDTDYSVEELEEDFGERVMKIVLAVTEPKEVDGKKTDWKAKKKAYVNQLKEAPEEALLVCAADKIHNQRSTIETYMDYPERFTKDFGGSLEQMTQVYQEISNILNKRLDNEILTEFNHVHTEYKNFISYVAKSTGIDYKLK